MKFLSPIRQNKKRLIAATLYGALIPLSLAPFNLYPLSIISLLGLLHLWKNASAASAALSGWFFGLGMYGAGVSWIYVSIHDFAYTPVLISIITTLGFVGGLALLTAAQGFLYGRFNLHRASLLTFPALWVLFEWLRSWLLTGFPWLYLGYGMIDTPLSSFAPVLGVFGLSWIIALSACLLYGIIFANQKKRIQSVLLLVVTAIACIALNTVQWVTLSDAPPLKVSLIQGNIPQETKWDADQKPIIMGLYREKTLESWDSDLIIWPEGAIPAYLNEVTDFLSTLDQQAQQHDTTLITGILSYQRPPESEIIYYNSIIALGKGTGVYHKQKLVPFGEFVPLQDQIRGLLPFLDIPMSSFTRGDPNQSNLTAGQLNIAPFICYEILYPNFVTSRSQNADLLITVSNDAWFGRSTGPDQHFQMARMRALELGTPLLRATNNGITAHIDHRGQVVAQAPSYEVFILNSEVHLTSGKTPFSLWGSSLIIIICFLSLIAGVVLVRTRHKHPPTEA